MQHCSGDSSTDGGRYKHQCLDLIAAVNFLLLTFWSPWEKFIGIYIIFAVFSVIDVVYILFLLYFLLLMWCTYHFCCNFCYWYGIFTLFFLQFLALFHACCVCKHGFESAEHSGYADVESYSMQRKKWSAHLHLW